MFHPALSLLFWAALVVGVQLLAGWRLAVACALLFAFAAGLARARLWRLLRRSRYLMLAIAVLFACFTPGLRVVPEPHWLPLTDEGVSLAALHLMRLMGVIALVAILLERLPQPDLVLGIAVLAAPLRLLGGDPLRLAVRLSLVLDLVLSRQTPDWRHWLDEPGDDEIPSHVALARRAFGWPDLLGGVAVVLVMGGLWRFGSA